MLSILSQLNGGQARVVWKPSRPKDSFSSRFGRQLEMANSLRQPVAQFVVVAVKILELA